MTLPQSAVASSTTRTFRHPNDSGNMLDRICNETRNECGASRVGDTVTGPCRNECAQHNVVVLVDRTEKPSRDFLDHTARRCLSCCSLYACPPLHRPVRYYRLRALLVRVGKSLRRCTDGRDQTNGRQQNNETTRVRPVKLPETTTLRLVNPGRASGRRSPCSRFLAQNE